MLKKELRSAPILANPDPRNVLDTDVLDTDVSSYGIGAVLSQIQDGKERVIVLVMVAGECLRRKGKIV